MAWACAAANEARSLVFIDEMTADGRSRMNSVILNAAKLIRQYVSLC